MVQKTFIFKLSVVVPVFNENAGLRPFNESLLMALKDAGLHSYEIIYCDDGSSDETANTARTLCKENTRIKLVKLSRNFGKENALAAGIAQATGDAIITLDGDGQHPVELIPKFVEAWQKGSRVVVGVRNQNSGEGWFKRWGSKLFYALFNAVSRQKLLAGSTDFCLIDSAVQKEFLRLTETDRITRGLIDWLGFKRSYIYFNAKSRETGVAGYSRGRLIKLAIHSFISMSPAPLYIFGFLGIFITLGSLLLGITVFFEQVLLGDPLAWRFTGTAMLSIMVLFLVGVILLSQGILSLYVSHIHAQSTRRPLYVIDYEHSILDLRKTSYHPNAASTESEAVLSEEGEAVASPTEEKQLMAGDDALGDAGILRKSSKGLSHDDA